MVPLRVLAVALLLPVAGPAACGRTSQRGLTLAGSTSLQPYAEKWAAAYQARQPGLPIFVQGGGSTAGVQAALSGAAQIGMSSRPLTAEEATRGKGIVVAREGIAIIVHPSNPVADLQLDQLRAVYARKIGNWRLVGGPDRPITVITREEGSGTRAAFESSVMRQDRIAAAALVEDATGAVRQMVASDPAAVGYVSLGFVDSSVKALDLQGVAPSEANIDSHRYPLVRPFIFVVAPARTNDLAMDFLDWITGPEGRTLTRQEGLLPPGV